MKIAVVVFLSFFARVAAAQWTVNAGVYDLSKHVRRVDCDSTGKNCDLYYAFQTTLAACKALRDKQVAGTEVGCVFLVPEGKHRLTQPVVLCRNHRIQGTGTWGTASSTQIHTDNTAFILRNITACEAAGLGHGGASTIHGLSLHASVAAQNQTPLFAACDDGNPATQCGIFGIQMELSGIIEHVGITGYTQGVRIYATGLLGSNANMWSLNHVAIKETFDAPVFVFAKDANAGTGYRVSAIDGCKRAEIWKTKSIGEGTHYTDPQGTCAGVWDRSFFGNTYIGGHADGNRDQTAQIAYPGWKLESSTTAYTVCVGCYSEGAPPSEMGPFAMALGGHAIWTAETLGPSFGYRQYGGVANGIAYVNRIHPTSTVTTRIATSSLEAINVEHSIGPTTQGLPWVLKYDAAFKGFSMQILSGSIYNIGWQTENGGGWGTLGQLKINCTLAPNVTGCTP